MKKQIIAYIAGVATTLVIVCQAPIMADNVSKLKEIFENTVKIKVEGNDKAIDNFIYNNKTYVPIRDVSELLGFDINWDNLTRQITIAKKDEIVATINQKTIRASELKKSIDLISQESKMFGQELSKEQAKEKAVEFLIENEVLKEQFKKNNITLSSEEAKAIEKNIDDLITRFGSKEQLENLLKQQGLDLPTYKNRLTESKLTEKLYAQIEKNDSSYVIDDTKALEYYNKNLDKYKKDQVLAKHILFKTIDDQNNPLPQAKIDEQKKKAEDTLKKIKGGADFDKLMKELSEDPGLTQYPNGYTFGKGEMVVEFEKAAFDLKENAVSELVKTNFGYHIIKTVKKYTHTPFDNIKQQIKNELKSSKMNDLMQAWKKEMKININNEILNKIN